MKTQPLNFERSRGQPRLWKLAVFFGLTVCGLAQPTITKQPTAVSVSVGATAQFRVTATTTSPPLGYQWRHQDALVAWTTNASLTLTNVQLSDAGLYTVAVSDATGTTNSQPATLDVDPTFTKITAGPLATDKGHWHGAAWGDFDNDGYPDLYVHQYAPAVQDFICHNNGDGTFTRLTSPIPQGLTSQDSAWGNTWGDYDNDGYLDLFIANNGGRNLLLQNRGDRTFQKISSGPGTEGADSWSATWGDCDRDGYLDLFVVNGYGAAHPAKNWFYHNQGDSTFRRMTTNDVGYLASESVLALFGGWVDYDEDGWQDLMLPVLGRGYFNQNLGNGSFACRTNGVQVGNGYCYAFADYDNDGRLDLCAGGYGTPTVIFHNEEGGTFKKMTAAEVEIPTSDQSWGGGVAWGDYDNDGFVDLFVAGGWWNSANVAVATKSFLYHNNGDGTFTRVTTGSPANDMSESMGVDWVDYDRDGFLDLFVNNHASLSLAPNLLYRNNGNSNNWLCVKCVGTSSPRFGTGAKVRAKATIRGKEMWQLRLIDAGGTCWGGQSFEAHFGLGDATVVETLRIEWPSGIVQEVHNVAAKQHLTVTEPVKLVVQGPGAFQIKCWKGMQFEVQVTTDFATWTPLAAVTNLTGNLQWTDAEAVSQSGKFYRVKSR